MEVNEEEDKLNEKEKVEEGKEKRVEGGKCGGRLKVNME